MTQKFSTEEFIQLLRSIERPQNRILGLLGGPSERSSPGHHRDQSRDTARMSPSMPSMAHSPDG